MPVQEITKSYCITSEGNTEYFAQQVACALIFMENGEQRFITFIMPSDSCTVKELLQQIGVPISDDSYIKCFMNLGGKVNYIVSVSTIVVDNYDLLRSVEEILNQSVVLDQLFQIECMRRTIVHHSSPNISQIFCSECHKNGIYNSS
jgi:hypothetical protein